MRIFRRTTPICMKKLTFWDIVNSLGTLILFGISIWLLIKAALKSPEESKDVIITLSITIGLISICFVIYMIHYSSKVFRLEKLLDDNVKQAKIIRKSEIMRKTTADHLSNMSYYNSKILMEMDANLSNKDTPDFIDVDNLCTKLHQYLSIFTTHLQSYFTLLTGDNSAITIKLVHQNDNGVFQVKTLYRDAISYNKRRESDIDSMGKDDIYDVTQNFAFQVIASKDFKDKSYVSDDLRNNPQYSNKNPKWQNYYNATAVVPIGILQGDPYILIGFLCVDNFKGNLNNSLTIGYLEDSASALLPILIKFDKLTNFAPLNTCTHEIIKKFTDWGHS